MCGNACKCGKPCPNKEKKDGSNQGSKNVGIPNKEQS